MLAKIGKEINLVCSTTYSFLSPPFTAKILYVFKRSTFITSTSSAVPRVFGARVQDLN